MTKATTEQRIVYNAPTIRSWKDEGHFVIPEVSYRGQMSDYALFESMTPAMSQQRLSELYETEKQKGNPVPTDMPLVWALVTKGYDLRSENSQNSERLRNFFRIGFRKYPNTLTRIIYNESGEDTIVHNYGTSDVYSIAGKIIGPDTWVKSLLDKEILESIIGTQDTLKIDQVSQWINQTDSYIWRVNSRPKQKIESVAWFIADGGRLGLYCGGGPLDVYPAFRVLKLE